MLVPGFGRSPALLPLLLGALLLGGRPGAGRPPAENPPRQVNGLRGGSVSFPLKLPPSAPVTRIEWFFRAGSGPDVLIAEVRDGKLERHRADGRFRQQLEMAGASTLRIRALQEEDGGVWKARVVLATYEVHEETFHLSVFGPVPDPQIRHQLVSQTAEGCNVTLHCLASEKGAFDISWETGGGQLRVLEEGSGRYWISAEGPDLHVSWRPDSSDPSVTCLLSNPVDRKSVSFDLLSICPREDPHSLMGILLLTVLSLILAVGLGIYVWKKRSSQGAYSLTSAEKRGSPEPDAELQKRRSPPEGGENQDPANHCSPCLVVNLNLPGDSSYNCLCHAAACSDHQSKVPLRQDLVSPCHGSLWRWVASRMNWILSLAKRPEFKC